MIRAPALIVSRSATWLLGLLLVYQKPSDMSEHLVYSDELDGLPCCISAWIWSLEFLRPGKTLGCNRRPDYLPYLTGTPVIYHKVIVGE